VQSTAAHALREATKSLTILCCSSVSGERLSLSLRVSNARWTRSRASSALNLQQHQHHKPVKGTLDVSGCSALHLSIRAKQQQQACHSIAWHTVRRTHPCCQLLSRSSRRPQVAHVSTATCAQRLPVCSCQEASAHQAHAPAAPPAVYVRHLASCHTALQV
jgi:hypothetical protein